MDVREIKVADLHAAFKVLALVPSKAGISSSDMILVDFSKAGVATFRLTSDILGAASSPARGSWTPRQPLYIDRRLLEPFISSVVPGPKSTEQFKWFEENKKVCVQWGTRKLEISPALAVEGYGLFTKLEGLKKLEMSEPLRAALAASSTCATNDPSVPHLNCVYLKNGRVYATDNVVLFAAEAKNQKHLDIPIPASIVGTLSSNLITNVFSGAKLVTALCKNGRLEQTVNIASKDKFPFDALDKQLEAAKKYKKVLSFASAEFGEICTRLSAYIAGATREEWTLRLEADEGKAAIRFICKVGEAQFREVLRSSIIPESAVVCEWPLDRLLSVFKYFGTLEKPMDVKVEEPHRRVHMLEVGDVRVLIAAIAKR